jgi:hypothetical protein
LEAVGTLGPNVVVAAAARCLRTAPMAAYWDLYKPVVQSS